MSGARKRHTGRYVAIGFIIVIIIAGFFAYRGLHKTSSGAVTYTTQAVQKLTITASVSGTGNISLSDSASVSPTISGTVSNLQVKAGDAVTKGQTLFTVVNPQLDLDVSNATNSYNQAVDGVQKAQLSVLQAEQSLDQLETQKAAESSASAAQVASSVELSAASADPVTDTTSPPTTVPTTSTTETSSSTTSTSSPTSTSPPTTVPRTTTTVPQTTTTFPRTTTTGGGSSGSQPSTTTTTISALQIEVAEQQVTSAKLSVTAAQAQVTSAKLALQQAKDTAAERTVTAPIAGVVTTLNVQNGDTLGSSGGGASGASSSTPIIITDTNSLEAIISLAETDVPNVKVGQKAVITFNALPNLTLSGKVQSVDTQGTNSQGVVTYNATIVPDTTDPSVKGGMSVTVNIITQIASDALVVPNAAVKTQTGGGSYVQVLQNGKPADVTVEVGISNDTYTQITSGLTEGQEVVTQTINPSAKTTSTTTRGGSGIPGLGGGGGCGLGGGGGTRTGGGG